MCVHDMPHIHYRYMYKLGAPTSVIQLQSEDTLTYLNKGETYTVEPQNLRTVLKRYRVYRLIQISVLMSNSLEYKTGSMDNCSGNQGVLIQYHIAAHL